MNPAETAHAARFKQLFEQLDDAVVEFTLVDNEPIILDTNRAFVDVFGYDSETVIGERLNELIVPDSQQTEAAVFDRRTAAGESNAAVVKRATEEGNRKFVYRGVPYADNCGFAIYTDITEQTRRERHLDVLQRVLRHNLRNDLNIVLGMADMIVENAETSQTREAAATIKQTANGLSRLRHEAKTVERVLGDSATLKSVALEPVVQEVVEACRLRFDEATITVDMPEEMCVIADNQLDILLENLVENAIEHNDVSDPQARIRATATDTTVTLEVIDNGPGIPAYERQIVTGEKKITPLNHGSGLGLWLVKWITDTYSGRLEIETVDRGGSVVRILLDRASN
jgi:PAS domain S-box-containing protein